MLATVLQRFRVQRVILVADRGLLSLDNIGALTQLADQGGRTLEFILAVPARRYGELVETFRDLAFDDRGLAEAAFRLEITSRAPAGEATVADDMGFDRRDLDLVVFADQLQRGVRRERATAPIASARKVVADVTTHPPLPRASISESMALWTAKTCSI